MLFLLVLKWSLKVKVFSCGKTKTNSNFPVKLAERSNHLFSAYLINHLECIELNWLWKQMKKFRSSQAPILINSCTISNKTQFFPVIFVKGIKLIWCGNVKIIFVMNMVVFMLLNFFESLILSSWKKIIIRY